MQFENWNKLISEAKAERKEEMRANQDIRELAKKSNVFLYEVADGLGIHEITFCRRMRKEMPEEEKAVIRSVIGNLARGK